MARAAVEGCFYPMGEEASSTARGKQLAKQVKKACPEAAKALAEAYELHPSDELIAALVIDFLAQVYTEHGGCAVVPIADLARVCEGARRFRGSGAEVKAAHAYSAPEYHATFCGPYACQDGKTCPPMREGLAEKCGHKQVPWEYGSEAREAFTTWLPVPRPPQRRGALVARSRAGREQRSVSLRG